MAYTPRPARLSTPSETDPDLCGNCAAPLIRSGGTQTHTDRSVLCDMDSCTDCYHAGEGKTRHCGSCPCCKVCDAHGAAGCPICNG